MVKDIASRDLENVEIDTVPFCKKDRKVADIPCKECLNPIVRGGVSYGISR